MRRLILDAAATAFATSGFVQTTTRTIAARADVSETLVFRHFGSKAALFDATVTERFGSRVDAFARRWELAGGLRDVRSAEAFARDLCRFVREHRDMVQVLLTVDSFEIDDDRCRTAVRGAVDRLRETVSRCLLTDGDGRPRSGIDPDISAPAVLALVLGVSALDRPLFGSPHDLPPEASLTEETVALVLFGIAHRGRRAESPVPHERDEP